MFWSMLFVGGVGTSPGTTSYRDEEEASGQARDEQRRDLESRDGEDAAAQEGSALIDNVVSELLRHRLTLAQLPERVQREIEREELVASVREAQMQVKEAEIEALRATEAASGARCEETGHAKVMSTEFVCVCELVSAFASISACSCT